MINAKQVRSYDPTRTTRLRNQFVAESNRRFEALATLVKKTVDDEDCFGLRLQRYATPGQNAFAFGSDMRKLAEFMAWLQKQIDEGIIDVVDIPQIGDAVISQWTGKYITESYKRGVERARQEMIKAGYTVPLIEITGGTWGAMQVPLHVQTVGLMYLRTFNDLKGITDAMSQQISRILSQGLIDGTNPRVLAKRLVAAINGKGVGELGLTDTIGRFIPAKRRAEILARTEIIRAHHYASVMEYKNWGVIGVNVMAEFKTAGDDRVCSVCASMEGNVYTLDEVLPLIPVHPQCRCIALPIVVDDKGKRITYN